MLNTWTQCLGYRCNDSLHLHTLWYCPCWSCEDHPSSEIRSERLSISTTPAVLFHQRSNVGIAHAAQHIAQVREILTSSHATPSCWTLERSGSNKDAMIVYTITCYDTGHAHIVRIILDLTFEVKGFQSRPQWLYFFTREAMSVSDMQHRISPGSDRFSPVPMQVHHAEHLNAVAWIKMQWSFTWSPIMILAMLILWGSSQIWDSKWKPFHPDNTGCISLYWEAMSVSHKQHR